MAQGMAGNIIHAIATTNAIVGGLIVIEALKLLAGHPEQCKVCAVPASRPPLRLMRLMLLPRGSQVSCEPPLALNHCFPVNNNCCSIALLLSTWPE